jgi:hypothetical protein
MFRDGGAARKAVALIAMSATAALAFSLASCRAGAPSGPVGPTSAAPPGVLTDASVGASFSIPTPTKGGLTDGGLIVHAAAGQAVTLTDVTLLDADQPAPVHLAESKVFRLPSADLHQAVGVRPVLPSALNLASSTPLAGAVVDADPASRYEILLGLTTSGPAAGGNVTAVKVSYRVGAAAGSQTFSHVLTICGSGDTTCGAAGRMIVEDGKKGPACEARGMADLTTFASGQPTQSWFATNVHSEPWIGSGGSAALSSTETATFSMQASATFEFSEGAGFSYKGFEVGASAMQTFHIGVSEEVSSSHTWSLTINIPPTSRGARLTVYIHGWAIPATTVTVGSDCGETYTYGTVYAAGNKPGSNEPEACIALDFYPGVPDLGPDCHTPS